MAVLVGPLAAQEEKCEVTSVLGLAQLDAQAVCEQLWLNFSFLNELEAWNVTRRTGYPLVEFVVDNQVSSYPTPPHRLPYVSDELTYNSQNCQEAISKNYEESTGYYTPLFWAKREYYKMIN